MPTRSDGVRLVVFDLDGTLADTFEDIRRAANHALGVLGREPLDLQTVTGMVGGGARRLMRRCLGGEPGEATVDRAFELWRDYYRAHPTDAARPYPGVPEMLDALRAEGFTAAILSNKTHELVVEIARALGFAPHMAAVEGEGPGRPRKPDPATLRAVMRRLGAAPERTLMVGDGAPDVEVARAAGVRMLGVGYGTLPAARLRELGAPETVERVEEIPAAARRLLPGERSAAPPESLT